MVLPGLLTEEVTAILDIIKETRTHLFIQCEYDGMYQTFITASNILHHLPQRNEYNDMIYQMEMGQVMGYASASALKNNAPQQALTAANVAVTVNSNDPKHHLCVGQALSMMGLAEAAGESFQAVLDISPNDGTA